MTIILRPYPAYRDSGIPWLPELPSTWATRRGKYLFRESVTTSEDGEGKLVGISAKRGAFIRTGDDGRNDTRSESLIGYKVCRPGQLIINIMLAWNGSLAVTKTAGLVSPAYSVFECLSTMDPDYADRLLRSETYLSQWKRVSTGVVDSRLRLYPEVMFRQPIIVPPLAEQRAIAAFLDAMDARITRFIAARRRLIALREEQKQAVITQAVTRGLDPDVSLRDSGIPWLGEIPVHWEVMPLKRELRCLNQYRIPLSSTERGAMKSRQFDYYGASGVIDSVDDYLFDDELILIAEDGANLVLRNLPLAIIACGKFWVNNHAHILKPRRGSLGYFAALLEAIDYRPWISGAAQPKLTQERLMNILIPVPPEREQSEIIDDVSETCGLINVAINRAKREIELMREYRTRLISDVVIGKLDVRGVELPVIDDLDDADLALVDEPEDGEAVDDEPAGTDE